MHFCLQLFHQKLLPRQKRKINKKRGCIASVLSVLQGYNCWTRGEEKNLETPQEKLGSKFVLLWSRNVAKMRKHKRTISAKWGVMCNLISWKAWQPHYQVAAMALETIKVIRAAKRIVHFRRISNGKHRKKTRATWSTKLLRLLECCSVSNRVSNHWISEIVVGSVSDQWNML